MESNAKLEATSRETKFAVNIQKAWIKACEIYLSESGVKEGSEEWTFINETKDTSQIIAVITETWAHYNNPSTSTAPEPARSVTSSSGVKKTAFNRIFGRKEPRKVLLQPAPSAEGIQQSYVHERSDLMERLTGKKSKRKAAAETGQDITSQLKTIIDSDKLQTVVESVLKFSDGLQALVSVSEVVSLCYNKFLISKWGPFASLALGCIRLFFKVKPIVVSPSTYLIQAAKDLWASYDLITTLLLDFNDIRTRIKELESIDRELLLCSVYMEAFQLLLKFIAILTRYVRNKQFGM
jgi:hypothetical protein